MWVPIRNHHFKGLKRDLCFYFFSVWKMAFFRSPIVYIALVCLEKVANHITVDQSPKQTHHTFFPKRETSISFVFCSLSSLGIDLPLIWVSEHYVVGSWSLWCIWNLESLEILLLDHLVLWVFCLQTPPPVSSSLSSEVWIAREFLTAKSHSTQVP